MTTQGAKGILIMPADSKAIVPAIKKARDAGRDRDRARHADRAAGRGRRAVRDRQPEGRRADRPVREGEGREGGHHAEDRDDRPRAGRLASACCATTASSRASASRRATRRSSARADAEGDRAKGQAAMENLLQKDPGINVVYSINEPSGFGGANALKAAGKDRRTSSSCPSTAAASAIKNGIKTGVIDATSQQYPLKMAELGVEKGAECGARRHEAVRLHGHGRDADHRRAAGGRRLQGLGVRHGELLGLVQRRSTRPGRPPAPS